MYLPTVALLLAASGAKANAVLAQRIAPASGIFARDIAQGWSVQSSSAPDGTTSCENGSYCPSSLHCNTAANHEVAACCSSSSDCRGDVEGAPKCADSSWSLWIGYDGNGFCCETGMVGAYNITASVAGTCVASSDVGSLRTAVLTSTGTGAASTSAAASSSSSASSASLTSAASVSSSSGSASKSSESSASTSSKASAKTTATSTGATSSGASSTGSATSSSSSAAATGNGAEKVGMSIGLIGAAFLAVAAL